MWVCDEDADVVTSIHTDTCTHRHIYTQQWSHTDTYNNIVSSSSSHCLTQHYQHSMFSPAVAALFANNVC